LTFNHGWHDKYFDGVSGACPVVTGAKFLCPIWIPAFVQ
jgi:hypothetical protein